MHVDEGKFNATTLRRHFFDKFAASKGFDSLVAANWYKVTKEEINSAKGSGILVAYQCSLMKALLHLYPSIGLDPTKFKSIPRNYWKSAENRRGFLVAFARRKKFDPLVAASWYSANIIASFYSSKKGRGMLASYYKGSLAKALLHLFPNIGVVESKLSRSRRKRKKRL